MIKHFIALLLCISFSNIQAFALSSDELEGPGSQFFASPPLADEESATPTSPLLREEHPFHRKMNALKQCVYATDKHSVVCFSTFCCCVFMASLGALALVELVTD